MEMKTAISCTILRHTKILIAVGVSIISLATLGSKNHTTNITKIVTQSIGRSEERFSRNAETDLVCRLLLEKKKKTKKNYNKCIQKENKYKLPFTKNKYSIKSTVKNH